MDGQQQLALDRLISIAQSDTGQSRKVADFLLSWSNTTTCGGFDPTDLWAVDARIAQDMIHVIHLSTEASSYPDTLGYRSAFDGLVRKWRPHLLHGHYALKMPSSSPRCP